MANRAKAMPGRNYSDMVSATIIISMGGLGTTYRSKSLVSRREVSLGTRSLQLWRAYPSQKEVGNKPQGNGREARDRSLEYHGVCGGGRRQVYLQSGCHGSSSGNMT